ncbi:hypothetical protein YH66_09565 [[Brevibacterium] flavum]|uniref:Uncharacterized protein n=1 Tax=[Brevibacterium] flavum TaxID=92706 RepID=A0A0F6Z702_9CORY|nr:MULTISPECIES: hypothetical protein [Corynebacterium]AKF27781.1 hypothetical protein YH66_09565 [[Brevibacterium] flavum]ANE08608.1 hypothetical protein A3654_09620 [Corynebacterium glutamicum]AST21022.1 hypothetical protein CEY17_09705 [Corynebacterium glutamicum ATCC 14067]KEI23531.1 hypothetical protein KIQ_013475 [Corynebacterium glutamicum ATCC 14067]OKX96005.1 hypothetical protein AUP71_01580 [Corynebacterium glutamicum]
MAIDPGKSTPEDVASISSLQSMTEESAKLAMRGGIDNSFGGLKINFLDLLGGLLGGAVNLVGKILEGAVELGSVIIGGVIEIGSTIIETAINGVTGLITGAVNIVSNVWNKFWGKESPPPPEPLPDIWSPIEADLEAAMQPGFDIVDTALANSQALGETALSHSQNALSIAEAAAQDAQAANEAIQGIVLEGQQYVDQARDYAESAQGYASSALGHAADALAAADQADQLNQDVQAAKLLVDQAVVDGQAEVTKAQGHASDAAAALAAAQGVQIDVEADAQEVQTKLVQIVGYHGEVLTAQGQAITAASGAAQSALDAAAELAAAQAIQVDINASLSRGVRAAGSAAAQASVATMMNSQAIEQVSLATQKALDAASENASALAAATTANEKAQQANAEAVAAEAARNEAQDAATRANTDALKSLQQYVTRVMFLADSTKVASVNNPHWLVTFESGKRKLKAKPGWVGEWIYHSAVHRSGDFGPVIEGGTVSAASREFLLDTATSSATLQYTIRPGVPRLANPPSVSGWVPSTRDTWINMPVSDTPDNLTSGVFTAKTAGEHEIYFRAGWDATTRNDSYGVKIIRQKVGGTVQTVQEIKQVGIGPLFSGQDGYRTQSIRVNLTLAVDEKVTFQAWAGASGADQRRMRNSEISVGWVDAPSDTSDIT